MLAVRYWQRGGRQNGHSVARVDLSFHHFESREACSRWTSALGCHSSRKRRMVMWAFTSNSRFPPPSISAGVWCRSSCQRYELTSPEPATLLSEREIWVKKMVVRRPPESVWQRVRRSTSRGDLASRFPFCAAIDRCANQVLCSEANSQLASPPVKLAIRSLRREYVEALHRSPGVGDRTCG
jgi:hypothetical protein